MSDAGTPAVTTTAPNATEIAIGQAAAASKGTMIEQLVAGLRRAGVSEEAIKHACESDGVEFPKANPAAGPDLRSETEKDIDAAGLSGAKSANDYQLNMYGKDAALVGELKAGFYSLGIPVAAAPGLADLMFEASDRFANLQPEGKTKARIAAREALENVFGKGAPAEAKSVLDRWRLAKPELVNRLLESDAFSDPRVLGQLVLIARRGK